MALLLTLVPRLCSWWLPTSQAPGGKECPLSPQQFLELALIGQPGSRGRPSAGHCGQGYADRFRVERYPFLKIWAVSPSQSEKRESDPPGTAGLGY